MMSTQTSSTCRIAQFRQHLYELIKVHFPRHQFDEIDGDLKSLKPLFQEYLGMSTAFPYLQAGSCGPMIMNSIRNNVPILESFELTSVVGSFLVWDELGGWYKTMKKGSPALPSILDPMGFHAALLKDDLYRVYGERIEPHYGAHTQKYLLAFYEKLASSDDLVRCAAMSSFELHAERMIGALWKSLSQRIPFHKNDLKYFSAHVGGDDPAEAYHVQMTEKLIESIVFLPQGDRSELFEKLFIETYHLHHDWCRSISQQTQPPTSLDKAS